MRKLSTLLKILIPLFLLGLIALYVYQVAVQKKDPMENLFELLIIAAGLVVTMAKLYMKDRGRRSPAFYEQSYRELLEGVFTDEKSLRQDLLKAIRYYNEDRYDLALRALERLEPRCSGPAEHRAVGIFTARVLTDQGLLREAAACYEALIRRGYANDTLHCNLGFLYDRLGEFENAERHQEQALFYNPKNESALNNLAQLHFHHGNLEKAEDYAKRALECNGRFSPASNLLALIYAIQEKEPEAEQYFRLAVANGEDPQNLRIAIQHFRSAGTEE
ncbi:MAG: tetratricopeptide repeat protein [Clostridia bacterium]|nr:tetratricopeptide repeat protein [Clostridia bacterium]